MLLPRTCVAIVMPFAGSTSTLAGAPGSGIECARLDDATARLACFDAAFPRPASAGAATTPAPVVRSEIDPQMPGLPQQRHTEGAFVKSPPGRFTAAVTAVRKLPSGYLLIDLNNGQQWQQTDTAPNFQLRAGDLITIRGGTFRSHLLVTASQSTAHVRRVR
ncbi:MAG: hypothetical protein IT480_15095 [Gammaproteobacteria bacterium]|nr:hypothetical protein [Gammaproteobacteria bacterium]